ncbi:competence protein CoiA [Bacillus alkalicellulosilyticus]|uniref:competence protein CoiA n=1 Tax=Alkalihalobacterium alkalicellulosilyticum TaxID=1912214 RepID=UPI0009965E3E|nr:competence protein CoiA family protein [Bacillus alkalicellulosilyticus]
MLTAIGKNGEPISLADSWSKNELVELERKSGFYCPVCKQNLQLKLGTKKQWHFAHKHTKSCSFESEAESEYHRKGKMQLYRWLTAQGYQPTLEPYLPSIQQRPDLLFSYQGRQIALEYQCSPIHESIHKKRTSSFRKKNILPFWIVGGNRIKRKGTYEYTIHSFEWLCTFSKLPSFLFPMLTYYCSSSENFYSALNLLPISSQKALSSILIKPLQKYSFTDILRPVIDNEREDRLFRYWVTVKKNWRYSTFPFQSSIQKFFQVLCYHHSMYPSLFPIEAGWPTPYSYFIETPMHIWQTWTLLKMFSLPQDQPILFRFLQTAFSDAIDKNLFHIRDLQSEGYVYSLYAYLDFLSSIHVLEKINNATYIIKTPYRIPLSVSDAIELDEAFFHRQFYPYIQSQNIKIEKK